MFNQYNLGFNLNKLPYENQVLFTLGCALKDCYVFDKYVSEIAKDFSCNEITLENSFNITGFLEDCNGCDVTFFAEALEKGMGGNNYNISRALKNTIEARNFLIYRFAYENYNVLDDGHHERKLILLIRSYHKHIIDMNDMLVAVFDHLGCDI